MAFGEISGINGTAFVHTFYTVTFKDLDDKVVMTQLVFTHNRTTAANPEKYDFVPTKAGHEFDYWSDESGVKFDFEKTPITSDITLKAVWKEEQKMTLGSSHVVTFDSNGGSAVEPQIVGHGEKATEPETPTREGYDFVGWFKKDGKEFDFDTEITSDITLIAKWKENSPPQMTTDFIMPETVIFEKDEVVKEKENQLPAGVDAEQVVELVKPSEEVMGVKVFTKESLTEEEQKEFQEKAKGIKVETEISELNKTSTTIVTIEETGFKNEKEPQLQNCLLMTKSDLTKYGQRVKITYYYYDEKTKEYKQLGDGVTISTDANLIIKNIYDGLRIVVESAL